MTGSRSKPMRTMKAMVLRSPGNLGLENVERPTLDHDHVLVRVTNSGVCGTDVKIYEGGIQVHHPLIMGHEITGELIEGGDEHIRNGARVVIDPGSFCSRCFHCREGQTNLCPHGTLLGRDANGGFAEYVRVPSSQVFLLPDAIRSDNAPLIQVLATCLHGQRLVKIFPGQSVVVVGLGVTGQLHVQLAKARGAHPVIGLTRNQWRRTMAEKLGADITVPSGGEGTRAVREATGGRGADIVIECTGKIPVIAEAASMVRLGGTLLLFGITTATEGQLPFYQFYYKELSIINSRSAKGEDFPAAIDLVARGILRLDPLVTHVIPLSELDAAIRMIDSDSIDRMKIILANAS
jgi:L-iditol 2-dehydrogenase